MTVNFVQDILQYCITLSDAQIQNNLITHHRRMIFKPYRGYGDLYPETQGQRIFGIFFVAGGIMVIGGVVLGIVFDALFETMQKSVAEKKAGTQTLFMEKLFRPNKEDDNEEDDGHLNESSSVVSAAVSKNKMLMGAAIAGAIFIPALTIGHFEDWSIVDSIYYAIVTATTGECDNILQEVNLA